MNQKVPDLNAGAAERSLGSSLLLSLPMMFLTLMIMSRGKLPSDPGRFFALASSFVFFNVLFFFMVRTKKTDRFRAVLFVTLSVCFVISFISHLLETRGSMALSAADMIEGGAPFCHLVIPSTIIPAAVTKTIVFPGKIIGDDSIASMFVLWAGVSLALGRGLCSWFCFFGGLEDGFSRLLRKPVIKKINPNWTYFPHAVLLVVILTAALALSPTYCEWLCPFKTVTEFVQITSVKILLQTVLFVSLFIALVVALPVLTKRRTQCGFFCPFGAFQSLTNKLNAFAVKVDPQACTHCMKCVRICPTFSVTAEGIAEGRIGNSCTKCGKCIDSCPQKALFFHIKGTPPARRERYRLLFLYPAFLVLATMAGGYVQDAILRFLHLITVGKFI